MKKGIFFLLIVFSVTTNAQSLKDALYGGKLKSDTGSVIRKTDDLSKKIDTTTKKQADSVKLKVNASAKDSSINGKTNLPDSAINSSEEIRNTKAEIKDNNVILKEYMDSIISTFITEVLPNKKIKNGSYFILVDYEIGTSGQVAFNKVSPSPENSFLQEQILERFAMTAPVMQPVTAADGKPRKVIRKYNFTLNKE